MHAPFFFLELLLIVPCFLSTVLRVTHIWNEVFKSPLKSFHNVRLESSSIRQNLPSPFPWLWFR